MRGKRKKKEENQFFYVFLDFSLFITFGCDLVEKEIFFCFLYVLYIINHFFLSVLVYLYLFVYMTFDLGFKVGFVVNLYGF